MISYVYQYRKTNAHGAKPAARSQPHAADLGPWRLAVQLAIQSYNRTTAVGDSCVCICISLSEQLIWLDLAIRSSAHAFLTASGGPVDWLTGLVTDLQFNGTGPCLCKRALRADRTVPYLSENGTSVYWVHTITSVFLF
jgi:hypothetical protein